jgi:hypothetical protein
MMTIVKLSVNTMGIPEAPAMNEVKIAKGRALGSLYPPIALKKYPPAMTPSTGPVTATVIKDKYAVSYVFFKIY